MRRNRQQGFTITEVVVVIAIIGAMAAIAIPAFSAFIPGMRLRAAGQEVYRAIQSARDEAIKRNQKVTVEFETENCEDLKPWVNMPYKLYVEDAPGSPIFKGVLPPLVAVCKEGSKTRKVTFKANGTPTVNAGYHIYLRNSKGRYLKANMSSAGGVRITNENPS